MESLLVAGKTDLLDDVIKNRTYVQLKYLQSWTEKHKIKIQELWKEQKIKERKYTGGRGKVIAWFSDCSSVAGGLWNCAADVAMRGGDPVPSGNTREVRQS